MSTFPTAEDLRAWTMPRTPSAKTCRGPYCSRELPVLGPDEEDRHVARGFCGTDCFVDYEERFDDSPHDDGED